MDKHFDFQTTIRLLSHGSPPGSRHFVTVPQEVSDNIRMIAAAKPRKGRWSVRVEVRIGWVKRETSIFPESKAGCYILPIKKEVRQELTLHEGDEMAVIAVIVKLIN